MPESTQPGLNPDGSYNSIPRPRPRFDLESAAPPSALLSHFQDAVEDSTDINGLIVPDNLTVELVLSGSRVRFWSPQLSLLLEESGTGSRIKARFGPHPHVWGMFLAGYALSGLLTAALLMLGLVQVFLDQTAWALYLAPVTAIGVGLIYGTAYIGQGLGAGQMHDLRTFLDQVLDSAPDQQANQSMRVP